MEVLSVESPVSLLSQDQIPRLDLISADNPDPWTGFLQHLALPGKGFVVVFFKHLLTYLSTWFPDSSSSETFFAFSPTEGSFAWKLCPLVSSQNTLGFRSLWWVRRVDTGLQPIRFYCLTKGFQGWRANSCTGAIPRRQMPPFLRV